MAALPPAPQYPNKYGTPCFGGSGTQLCVDQCRGSERVYAVATSADGRPSASGRWYSSSPSQGFIRGYDVANGPAFLFDFRLGERVNSLALSSDGSTLVAGADKVYLFQQANGTFPSEPAELALASAPAGSTTMSRVH